jgi:hypothetical protein
MISFRTIAVSSSNRSQASSRRGKWLAVAFFVGLASCYAVADANMICICVDCPAGSSIGIPVGIGHAFVQMMPMFGPQNGRTLAYGYYPSVSSPYATGVIKNDGTHAKDFCICYNVTQAQYNAAAGVINARITTPGTYNVLTNNCVDFAAAVATAAGITLPTTVNRLNISDPAAAWSSLNAIGNNGTSGGGTVTTSANIQAPGTPKDYSYVGLTDDGHMHPATLAGYTGTTLTQTNLGTVNANFTGGMSFSLANADLANSIVSMNWGDGSLYDDRQSSFTHVYSPGTYNADLFVLDAGSVQRFNFTVNVNSSAPGNLFATVASFSPTTLDNSGGAAFNSVESVAIPEPSAMTLLAGAGLTLLRRRRAKAA